MQNNDQRGLYVRGFSQWPGGIEADRINGNWQWHGFDRMHGSALYSRDGLWMYIDSDRRWRVGWSQSKDSRQARDSSGRHAGVVRSSVMEAFVPPWDVQDWQQKHRLDSDDWSSV